MPIDMTNDQPKNTVVLMTNIDGQRYGLGFKLKDYPTKELREQALQDLYESALELFYKELD